MAGNVIRGGAWLKALRDARGMTQGDVERRTIDPTTGKPEILAQQVSRLEAGQIANPTAPDFGTYAKLFGVTPNEMFEEYGYWDAGLAGKRTLPDDERLRFFHEVLRQLDDHEREKLLSWVYLSTRLVLEEQQRSAALQLPSHGDHNEG